jgi:hypothetical protein
VKMKLGQLFDDPMLSSVNTKGSFVLFGIKGSNSDSSEPIVGLIVPIKGDEFAKKFSNSDIGSDNYRLFVLTDDAEHANAELTSSIGKSSLVSRLDDMEYHRATTSPLWAYGNILQISKDFRKELNSTLTIPEMGNGDIDLMNADGLTLQERRELRKQQLEERDEARRREREGRAEQPIVNEQELLQQQSMEMLEAYISFIKTFINDADYASLVIEPAPERLDVKLRYAAQEGRKLARWLNVESQTPNLRYLNMLDGKGAFSMATKFNKNNLAELYDFSSSVLTTVMDPKAARSYKSIMNKSMSATGDEMAFTFSLTEGAPPFSGTSIMNVRDPQTYKESQIQVSEMMNEILGMNGNAALPNMPVTYSYQDGYTEYDGVIIDRMLLTFDMPSANAQEAAIINSMFGDGFDYRIAYTDDMVITVMGPYPDEDIIYTLDRRFSDESAGDIATILDYLPDAGRSTFAGALNIPNLIQGVSGMIKSLPLPASQSIIVSSMLDGLGDGEIESCIAFSGNIKNGSLDTQIVLPKEHLQELIAIFTQIQARIQRMQEQQIQQIQVQQGQEAMQLQDLPPEVRQQIINDLELQIEGKSPEEQMNIRMQIEQLQEAPIQYKITETIKKR